MDRKRLSVLIAASLMSITALFFSSCNKESIVIVSLEGNEWILQNMFLKVTRADGTVTSTNIPANEVQDERMLDLFFGTDGLLYYYKDVYIPDPEDENREIKERILQSIPYRLDGNRIWVREGGSPSETLLGTYIISGNTMQLYNIDVSSGHGSTETTWSYIVK